MDKADGSGALYALSTVKVVLVEDALYVPSPTTAACNLSQSKASIMGPNKLFEAQKALKTKSMLPLMHDCSLAASSLAKQHHSCDKLSL